MVGVKNGKRPDQKNDHKYTGIYGAVGDGGAVYI